MTAMKQTKILFVCLGNICRSPSAQGAFEYLTQKEGVADRFEVDSAGTGDWHLGEAPDKRAQAACKRAGFDISHLRARLVKPEDFTHYDLILACDSNNYRDLQTMAKGIEGASDRIRLLMPYAGPGAGNVIPDPWYGNDSDFDSTVRMALKSCKGLLESLI